MIDSNDTTTADSQLGVSWKSIDELTSEELQRAFENSTVGWCVLDADGVHEFDSEAEAEQYAEDFGGTHHRVIG